MMRNLILLAAMLLMACYPQDPITIYLIGDSTMADKPNPDSNPERGWGQLFPVFFKEGIKVENHAVNGRSSRSFINEGRWDAVYNKLKPGDYVFIQFGHNDQKKADPARYTNPYTAYKRNIRRYVKETMAKGAFPVILSSIVRRNFNEQGTLVDTHGAYPFVAEMVAGELEVPFVDMQLLTGDLVRGLGEEASKEYFMWVDPGEYEMYPEGKIDNTHLSEKGARAFSRLVAEDLVKKGHSLADFIKLED